MVAPSGEQIELTQGRQAATVVTVGGGIRRYDIDGTAVLDGYDEDAVCDGARGQQLVPWPNRVKDGHWTWRGREQQLALTEPEQRNAIHGFARWAGWQVLERDAASVRLGLRINPQPGWDWPLDITSTHSLAGDGLTVTTTITNRGSSPAPVAAGAHPYLTAGTPSLDEASLLIPAAMRILTGPQQIPIGTEPVAGTDFDFRSPVPIGDRKIDFAFTELVRDADGRARVRLEATDGRWAALWVDESFPWVEIFTGDALPDPARRRQGLGVEPMSAPPNALATGEGLVVLDPEQTWSGRWGIESSLLD
jgi:aldose 1-epimerase